MNNVTYLRIFLLGVLISSSLWSSTEQAIAQAGGGRKAGTATAASGKREGARLYELGNQARVAKNFAAAESLFKRATLADPQNGPAWRQLGLLFMANERFAEAEIVFTKAIECQLDAANLLGATKDMERARIAKTATLLKAEEASAEWVSAALNASARGNLILAQRCIKPALTLEPRGIRENLAFASILAQAGRFQDALDQLVKLKGLTVDVETLKQIANVEGTLRRNLNPASPAKSDTNVYSLSGVAEMVEKTIAAFPDRYEGYLAAAKLYVRLERIDDAKKSIAKVNELRPEGISLEVDAEVKGVSNAIEVRDAVVLARAASSAGAYGKAADYYRKAAILEPATTNWSKEAADFYRNANQPIRYAEMNVRLLHSMTLNDPQRSAVSRIDLTGEFDPFKAGSKENTFQRAFLAQMDKVLNILVPLSSMQEYGSKDIIPAILLGKVAASNSGLAADLCNAILQLDYSQFPDYWKSMRQDGEPTYLFEMGASEDRLMTLYGACLRLLPKSSVLPCIVKLFKGLEGIGSIDQNRDALYYGNELWLDVLSESSAQDALRAKLGSDSVDKLKEKWATKLPAEPIWYEAGLDFAFHPLGRATETENFYTVGMALCPDGESTLQNTVVPRKIRVDDSVRGYEFDCTLTKFDSQGHRRVIRAETLMSKGEYAHEAPPVDVIGDTCLMAWFSKSGLTLDRLDHRTWKLVSSVNYSKLSDKPLLDMRLIDATHAAILIYGQEGSALAIWDLDKELDAKSVQWIAIKAACHGIHGVFSGPSRKSISLMTDRGILILDLKSGKTRLCQGNPQRTNSSEPWANDEMWQSDWSWIKGIHDSGHLQAEISQRGTLRPRGDSSFLLSDELDKDYWSTGDRVYYLSRPKPGTIRRLCINFILNGKVSSEYVFKNPGQGSD